MIEQITREVLRQVKPGPKDAERLRSTAKDIIARLNATAADMSLDVHAIHVGSTARDTWLKGKKDIDIFLMFPPETPRGQLETMGLVLARSLSGEYEEKYAEHPYIRTSYGGFEVDLVPCYRVPDPAHIQSAVDRSPFHNTYVLAKIDGLCDEARLAKQLMHGASVYGSELKTQGFSGYLCELLTIRYGSFMGLVKAGANFWKGMVIDIEGHMDKSVDHPEPLIVIDPVDPRRNVAAALSEQKLFEFVDACRSFLAAPSIEAFFPPEAEPIEEAELIDVLARRGTLLLAVTFRAPDIVEDSLYPQLRKVEESAISLLERREFRAFTSGVWSGGQRGAIVFEMLVWELPGIQRHPGPPVDQKAHAARFREKYPGAYVYGGRYAVDLPRQYTSAEDLLRERLTECALGKDIAASIKQEYVVLSGASLLSLGPGMGRFLRKFLR